MITSINEFKQLDLFNKNITEEDMTHFRNNIRVYLDIGMNISAIKNMRLSELLSVHDIDDGVRIEWSKMTDDDFILWGKLLGYKINIINNGLKKQLLQTFEKSFKKTHYYNYDKLSELIDFNNKTIEIKMKNSLN